MPSYQDVWSKILQKEYLEILTDFSADQKVIRSIDMFSEWGSAEGMRSQNMTYLFDKHNANPTKYEAFKMFMLDQNKDFNSALQKQQAITQSELEEERKKKQAEEEERLKKEKLAEVMEDPDDEEERKYTNTGELSDYKNSLLDRKSPKQSPQQSEAKILATELTVSAKQSAALHHSQNSKTGSKKIVLASAEYEEQQLPQSANPPIEDIPALHSDLPKNPELVKSQ